MIPGVKAATSIGKVTIKEGASDLIKEGLKYGVKDTVKNVAMVGAFEELMKIEKKLGVGPKGQLASMLGIILAHGKVTKSINGKLAANSLDDAAEVMRRDGLSSELKDLSNADDVKNLGKDMDDALIGSKANTMETIVKDSKQGTKLKNESLAEEGKNAAKASDDIGIISKDASEIKNIKNDINDVVKNEGKITNEATEVGQAIKDETIAKDMMMDAKSAEKATSTIVDILKSDMNNLFDHVLETVKQGTKIIFTMAENGKKVAIEIADLVKNKISDAAIDFCITGCFTGDTLVLSKEGYVKIEDIKIGDYVFSQDVRTGEKGFKEVLQIQKRNTSEFVKVKLEDEEIQVTPSHLFYTNGQWELAGNLKAGDILTSSNGEEKKVISVEEYLPKEAEAIYNLSVEEYHTYFVGEFGILVHNMGCSKITKGYKGDKEFYKVSYDTVVATGKDKSGKVVEKWVIPKGYESVDDFLEKISNEELKAMGYDNKEEFSDVVQNLEKYLNNGKSPRLINQEFAGSIDKTGVKRDVLGFPIFEDGHKVFETKLKKDLYEASDNDQFKECTKQLKKSIENGEVDSSVFTTKQLEDIKNEKKRIKGYIWHHNQVTGKMQLVKDTIHNPAKHTGGQAIWGGGNENR